MRVPGGLGGSWGGLGAILAPRGKKVRKRWFVCHPLGPFLEAKILIKAYISEVKIQVIFWRRLRRHCGRILGGKSGQNIAYTSKIEGPHIFKQVCVLVDFGTIWGSLWRHFGAKKGHKNVTKKRTKNSLARDLGRGVSAP